MTTEQMDWLDDERAGRHKPPAFRAAPAGWFTFGTHAGSDLIGVKLEFSSELDEGGDPLWERVVQPEMHTDEEWAMIRDEKNGIRAWGMSGIPEIMFGDPSDEQLAAAQERSGRNGVLIIPERFKEYLEPYWRERVTDAEEHTHHTREARDQCAAGDHKYAVLLDDAAEREKIKATIDAKQGEPRYVDDGLESHPWAGETTMAEEPIEHRLRRAWLNGYTDGYSEGFNRAAYQTNWER